MVCERLLKEQEEQIREEYDKVLSNKLAGPSKPGLACSPF
jgi:hypothetical protein